MLISSILERLVDVDGGFEFLENLIVDMVTKNHINFKINLILHPCIFGDCVETCSFIRGKFPYYSRVIFHQELAWCARNTKNAGQLI